MEYKNYKIQNKNNFWIILDNNDNQLCDNIGDELVFNSEQEAKNYIDEWLS